MFTHYKKFNINSVTLKYLIVGHTQNEGDSMHARIEDEAKRILKGGPYMSHLNGFQL